jgi:hypothetical protein
MEHSPLDISPPKNIHCCGLFRFRGGCPTGKSAITPLTRQRRTGVFGRTKRLRSRAISDFQKFA